MFGESIPALSSISKLLKRCDLLLVIGTSSVVYPAAGFADQVQAQGGKVAVFNLERGNEIADWFFEGPVEDTLSRALQSHTQP
jgi:NAD-dependent deacetylase sirtuin 5